MRQFDSKAINVSRYGSTELSPESTIRFGKLLSGTKASSTANIRILTASYFPSEFCEHKKFNVTFFNEMRSSEPAFSITNTWLYRGLAAAPLNEESFMAQFEQDFC